MKKSVRSPLTRHRIAPPAAALTGPPTVTASPCAQLRRSSVEPASLIRGTPCSRDEVREIRRSRLERGNLAFCRPVAQEVVLCGPSCHRAVGAATDRPFSKWLVHRVRLLSGAALVLTGSRVTRHGIHQRCSSWPRSRRTPFRRRLVDLVPSRTSRGRNT